jgi:hypothetical protein
MAGREQQLVFSQRVVRLSKEFREEAPMRANPVSRGDPIALPAHYGLVAGSSPAGPTTGVAWAERKRRRTESYGRRAAPN